MMLNRADFERETQSMTRMLNARYEIYNSSEMSQGEGDHHQQACDNLDQVAWVGITEHLNESICILHSKYKFGHHPMEKAHVRPAAHDAKRFNLTLLGELIRMRQSLTDDAIYNCARQRFERELLLYPHCQAVM